VSLSITEKEPIAAIATPIGEGGIAVLRVSGRGSIEKVQQIFKGVDLRKQASHTVHFGRILDANHRIVDEVLVSSMHLNRIRVKKRWKFHAMAEYWSLKKF
jgi:tRNA modification GTPase